MKQVNPEIYTSKYYLTDCGGWDDWKNSNGEDIKPRLSYPLKLASIKKGDKILDFGSGRGEMAYHAAMKGADVLGLDYSKSAIKLAKSLPKVTLGKLKFVNNKSLKINLKKNTIDTIFFIDVYEHLYPAQLKVLLKEFRRVLKPNGKIILHTAPNRNFYDLGYKYYTRWANMLINPLYRIIFGESLVTKKNPRGPYDAKVHINEATIEEVDEMFLDTGFSRINSWLSSDFRNIRIRDHIKYLFLQPQLRMLKKWFAYDIWAVVKI